LPPDRRPIPRVIPCLLVDDEAMVKTVRFEEGVYLGDPVNVINLFNRFEVDEITLLDVRATVEDRAPVFDLIEHLAAECWVPLSYGGGIRTIDDVRRILSSGVEKVVLGTAAADNPALITEAARVFGAQAVIVAVDARRTSNGAYETYVASGTRPLGLDPASYARLAASYGAGEILVTSIDRDGTMEGYDVELIRLVAGSVDVPVIACGGAGDRSDIAVPIQAGASAVAAGSIFVFQGPERGVLINFPDRAYLEDLLSSPMPAPG
jgi:imidazole glycerol-phosphate synthase subunit HisF